MIKKFITLILLLLINVVHAQSYATSQYNNTSNEISSELSLSISNWLNLELYSSVNIINDYFSSINSDQQLSFVPKNQSAKSQNIIIYDVKIDNGQLIVSLKNNEDGISNDSFPISLTKDINFQKNIRFELRELLYATILDDENLLNFLSFKEQIESDENLENYFSSFSKELTVDNGKFDMPSILESNHNIVYFVKSVDSPESLTLNHDKILFESNILDKVTLQIGYFFKTEDSYIELFEQNLTVNIKDELPKAYDVRFNESSELKEYIITLNGKDDKMINEYIIVDYPDKGTLKPLGSKDFPKYVYVPYDWHVNRSDTEKITINDSFTYNVKDSKNQTNRFPGQVTINISYNNLNYKPSFLPGRKSKSSSGRTLPESKTKDTSVKSSDKDSGGNLLTIIGGLLLVVLLLAGGGDDDSGNGGSGNGGSGNGGSGGDIDIDIGLP